MCKSKLPICLYQKKIDTAKVPYFVSSIVMYEFTRIAYIVGGRNSQQLSDVNNISKRKGNETAKLCSISWTYLVLA